MRMSIRSATLAAVVMAAAPLPAAAEVPEQPERGDPFTTPLIVIPEPETDGDAAPRQAERLPVMEMTVGDMEVIRLPQPAGTIISLVPGVVTVGTQEPGMLFIFAEQPGETKVVVADEGYNEMFASTIKVEPPEPGL
ncbi:pilus assembly protein N-terminal domain-containing protein [Caenispirillum salinarum]|uniref:pilus assembly protein N-terminal domain-containing protein n=1 Tax=Caenispirillum salinarum TaxID=859058 RepID=UPI00384A66F0